MSRENASSATVYRVDVRVHAPVNGTEVTDRVRDAVENLFPGIELEHRGGELVGETHSLEHLSQRLREQAILDTARREFLADLADGTFTFRLKKQAAFRGVVNFAVGSESELGDVFVEVTVHEPDAETYVRHVAPPTKDGVPIDDTQTR